MTKEELEAAIKEVEDRIAVSEDPDEVEASSIELEELIADLNTLGNGYQI